MSITIFGPEYGEWKMPILPRTSYGEARRRFTHSWYWLRRAICTGFRGQPVHYPKDARVFLGGRRVVLAWWGQESAFEPLCLTPIPRGCVECRMPYTTVAGGCRFSIDGVKAGCELCCGMQAELIARAEAAAGWDASA